MRNTQEIISVVPEDYEYDDDGRYNSKNNFVLFKFFEHIDYMKKYVSKRRDPNNLEKQRKIKFLETIKLPLTRELFMIQMNQLYEHMESDFVPNLLFQAAQKHGGSIQSILAATKEALNISEDDWYGFDNTKFALTKVAGLKIAGTAWDKISSGEVFGLGIGYLAAKALDTQEGPDITTGIKFAEGVAYNSNRRPIYRGESIVPRGFNLTYEFFPKSEEEAKNLRKAEYVISKNALPEQWSGFGNTTSNNK